MKHGFLHAFGIVTAAILALGVASASAQTTANGPYYATPSWDQKLQCDTQATCPRFVVLANWIDPNFPAGGAAVLDRETGLVWQRSPFMLRAASLGAALEICLDISTGGRFGWRLPSAHELSSLFDPSSATNPPLPSGHPFLNIPSGSYWTATASLLSPGFAYQVATNNPLPILVDASLPSFFWCVRGGGPLPLN